MTRFGDWVCAFLGTAMIVAAATVPVHADDKADKAKAAEILRKRLEGDVDSGKLQKGTRLTPDVTKDQTLLASPVEGAEQETPSEGLTLLQRMGQSLPDLPAAKPYTGKIDPAYGAYQRGMYLEALNIALPKAQLGDAAAQTLVAELMNNGLGVRRNPADASFWYEQAARAGDANAQYKYALMLLTGENNVKQDRKSSDAMMRKAADGGNREAQFNIAQLLTAKTPGLDGLKQALPYYEKAALQGVPDAQYAVSQLYYHMDLPREKRQESRDWLRKAALAGYDTAQYDLAMWLINGVGGERSFEDGFRWMRIAANRGHVAAQNKLAKLYVNAIGTRPDPIEATKWYVLSRKAGLADLELEDFFLGIDEETQKEGIARAEAFSAGRG
ncbi:tetratricopeptide repeat protein [Rhizobium sp.]